jgi:hypothetical protein
MHALRGTPALVLACLGLGALTLLLPSAPTYDPWAWINWGREVAGGDLSTVAGPSWKPLPVLLTTPFSLAGDAAPELWLWVARGGGFLAVAMAARLAARLTGRGAAFGAVAGVLAGASLLVCDGYVYTMALGNSEGLLVAFVLWGFERHLDARRGQAFVLGVLAALLRPEAWPFLGLYALWLWWVEPALRVRVALALAAVAALWFPPELWGSGELLRSATRATEPTALSPAFADRPALAVLARAAATVPPPALVGLALAVAAAIVDLRARRAEVPALLAVGVAWLGLVAVMTETGYSGNFRYLLVPVALACVLGGVGWGRALGALARLLPGPPAHPAVAAGVSLVLLAGASVPFAGRLVEGVPREAAKLRYEAALYDSLALAVDRAGGRGRVLGCGPPVAGDYQVPGLAWRLRVHGIDVRLDVREAGTVFRAPPVIGARPEPRLHSAHSRLRPVARAGPWLVLASCRSRADSVRPERRPAS